MSRNFFSDFGGPNKKVKQNNLHDFYYLEEENTPGC